MLLRITYLFILLQNFGSAVAGNKISPEQYIQKFKDDAIVEMEKFNIPASITLAQAMLESSNGNSDLAIQANNHFGIKCHNNWNGPTFIKDDDKKDECFRKYESVLYSYNDHSQFLSTYSRYAFLFQLKRTDYKGWAKGLKQAGYATNPKYPEILIRLIEDYQLYKYDTDKEDRNSILTTSNKTKRHETKQYKTREILRIGIKKYIIIQSDDSIEKIAKETDKDTWQLYKYNDLSHNDKLTAGQKLFLQPKRNKAKVPFHKVKEGETMKFISQLHGIKLKSLYHKNNMNPGEEPKMGDTLYLRKNKPADSF